MKALAPAATVARLRRLPMDARACGRPQEARRRGSAMQ